MLRFAFSASFTADPLERAASFWAKQLGLEIETVFAPYGRVFETVVDPNGALAVNANGANFVLLRWEDLGTDEAQMLANGRELIRTLAQRRFRVPTIVSPGPATRPWEDLARTLDAELSGVTGLQVLLPEDVQRWYPTDSILTEQGERLGHVPYTDGYFAVWGTALVRRAHSLLMPPLKVIAVDADDTLWSGVVGEDGSEGIQLTPGREYLQRFLLDQRSSGRLLALASKNNPGDVAEAFARHPEFPLQPEHFAAQRIGWTEKSGSLAEMARQLNLSLDSFAFVDDSTKECGAVARAHPEVVTIPLPHADDALARFLDHIWVFDRGAVTAEDAQRARSYEDVAQFSSARASAATLDDFYATLDLQVTVEPVEDHVLPRAAQLTQRTNQFNVSTIRRTEGELIDLRNTGWQLQSVRVSDRFGDYGVTGLVIYRTVDATLDIDTLLLSCRVLGRGVEHEVVRNLASSAQAEGAAQVAIRFAPTGKNEPARRFLYSLPGHQGDFRFDAATLAQLQFQPEAAPPAVESEASPAEPARSSRPFVDYARIARELASADQIVRAIRGEFALPDEANSWPETERSLARIWSELLEKPVTSRSVSFFDLGGHSLLAVLLLTRIEETFGVSLSIEAVYDSVVTVESLAARIEAARAGVTSDDDYVALLAEIAAMSDDEVRQLLEQENAGPPAK